VARGKVFLLGFDESQRRRLDIDSILNPENIVNLPV